MASAGRGGAGQASEAWPFSNARSLSDLVARNPAGGGAHHVEHVERRHARPGFGQLHPWIRQIEALAGGADRQPQLQPLVVGAGVGDRQRRGQLGAARVEEQRVLAQPLREDPLGQSRHEHHAEAAAADGLRRADEDAAVPAPWRLMGGAEQARGEHFADLAQGHRARRWPSGAISASTRSTRAG